MHAVYLKQLQKMPLFEGIKEIEIDSVLTCLGSYLRSYKKGEIIFLAGESIKSVGVILSGSVNMIKEDIWHSNTYRFYENRRSIRRNFCLRKPF